MSSAARPAVVAKTPAAAFAPWWGRFDVPQGQGGSWRLGPLALDVWRQPLEWKVAVAHDEGPAEDAPAVRCPILLPPPAPEVRYLRFASRATTSELIVTPRLPDRPLVARPELPLRMLGNDQVTVYVGTPVWVRLATTDDRLLTEQPTQRLSETWFGPSTLVGELGYASRTIARLELDKLPRRPHIAVTALTVTNRAADPLLVERIKLPAPHLGLWWHPAHGLWTQGMSVEREADGSLANLRLADDPPDEVAGAQPVAAARQPQPRQTLVRALSALLA